MTKEYTLLEVSDGTETVILRKLRNGWGVEIQGNVEEESSRQRLLEAATQTIMLEGGGRLEYWIEDISGTSDRVPLSAGFTPCRDLWRLERPLPAPVTALTTRPYEEKDAEAFLVVNNRAFDWHPEQGGMTSVDLANKCAEPWFNSNGFRILEKGQQLAGFCWTKIHKAEIDSIGEIYAIAVDPNFHGERLGRELVLAGLAWLTDQGLEHCMLYVESDNHHANQVYTELDFQHVQTNRAYQRIVR